MFWTFLACVALLLLLGVLSDRRLQRHGHRFADGAAAASEARRRAHP